MNCKKISFAIAAAAMTLTPAFAAEETGTGFSAINRLRFEYDDNVREATHNKTDSFKIIEELELIYNVNTETTYLGLRYMPSFVWFENRKEDKTDFHHQFDGALSHKLSDSVELSLKDIFRRSELPELIESTGVVRENNDYNYNSVNAALDLEMTPTLTLKGEGRHTFLAYDETEVANNSDYDQLMAQLSLIKAIDKLTLLAGEAVFETTDYDDKVRSYDSTQVGLSLERQLSGTSFLNVRTGYEIRSFDESTISDAESPYVSGTVVFNLAPTTRANLNASYYMSQTPTSAFASQDKAVFGAGVEQGLTADLSLNVSASYAMGEYDDAYATSAAQSTTVVNAEDKLLRVAALLSYKVNPENSLEVSWQYVKYDTELTGTEASAGQDFGLRDYERNRISLGWRTRL